MPATILVQAKDDAGNLLKSNQETFTAAFSGAEVVNVVSRPVNPDAMNGLYRIEYLLQKAGMYQLRVMLANKNIKDSPFQLKVVPGSVASATTHALPIPGVADGTEEAVAGSEAQFYVQTQDAYENDLDREATDITVAAQWQGYYQQSTIPIVDDGDILTAEFGRIYFG